MPHVKIEGIPGIVCLFARMAKPIDFESPDGEPVDLIFLLLAPDHAGGDHLKALARISRLVREPGGPGSSALCAGPRRLEARADPARHVSRSLNRLAAFSRTRRAPPAPVHRSQFATTRTARTRAGR